MKRIPSKIVVALFLLFAASGTHAQLITTVAGIGIAGAGSGGGPATMAELAGPVGICIDPGNQDVYIADSANNLIRKVDHGTGIITTVAGGGLTGLGDGGPATFGMLSKPTGVCVDAFHNLYIADYGHSRIRKVIHSSGVITTIVNTTGSYDYLGDGGSALLAKIKGPYGVRIDGMGNLFIADRDANVIREVSGGIISTVAGYAGGFGKDGGPATSAELNQPVGVAVDMYNNIYIADQVNNVVRMVNSSTGLISTIAGNTLAGYSGDGGAATSAKLSAPTGVVYDNAGSVLYIADMGNNCIRKIDPLGVITTVVNKVSAPSSGWSPNGTGAFAAMLNHPTGLFLSGSGATLTMYIADAGNNEVRKVTLGSTNLISTIAGDQALPAGYSGDGRSATAAQLSSPSSITMDNSTPGPNLYIADANNNRVREVLTTGSIAAFSISSPGAGYTNGDVVTIPPGTATATLFVTGGVITGITLSTPNSGYVPSVVTPTGGTGTGLRITITAIDPTIITFAGSGSGAGALNGDGNAAASTSVRIFRPTGVVFDPASNAIYISEHDSDNIRIVPLVTNIISTVAGTNIAAYGGNGVLAVNAGMNHPYGIAVDAFGNVYTGDADNERVRKIYFDPSSGASRFKIYDVAGNSWGDAGYGGLASYIDMFHSSGIALSTGGDIYIADQGNHVVRKVDAHGVLHIVAGTGVAGYTGDGGNATDAQLDLPYAVAYDNGNSILYIADAANSAIRKVMISTGIITTIAGTGVGGYISDGVPASTTRINSPSGIDVNPANGNLYIADRANNRVRLVTYYTNIISTYAGTGVFGYLADGGPATAAELNAPYATTVDTFGNIYIADRDNNIIRKVNQVTGAISTIAGDGSAGYAGDGAAASLATLDGPNGITLDPTFKILYISDAGNNVIRKIDMTTNMITRFAGNPTPITGVGYVNGPATTTAKFYYPTGLCTDNAGNVYVADGNNNAIRKITIGVTPTVSTVAGGGPYLMGCSGNGGPAVSAALNSPTGVCFDKMGTNMYIADFGNCTVRKVDAAGTITDFAGIAPIAPACTPVCGFAGDGGPATAAMLNQPTEVATDKSGNVFISDFGNNRIRMVNGAGIIKTVAGKGTAGYSGDGGAAPNAELNTPFGVSVDTSGNYYIADKGNNVIRKVTTVLLASYTSTGSGVCQDSCVTFYNTSLGNTDSLRWSTTAPAAIIASPTSDTTTICFNTAGSYTVSLNIYYRGKNNSSVHPIDISPTPVPVIGQSGTLLSVSSAYSAYQWSIGGVPISGAVSAVYSYSAGGTYTVTVDSNGCPGSASITVSKPGALGGNGLTNSIANKYWLSQSAQNVNTVTLHALQLLTDDLSISMYDATGREILNEQWKQGSNSIEVNGPTLAPGLYIIRLNNTTTSSVLKWQKE